MKKIKRKDIVNPDTIDNTMLDIADGIEKMCKLSEKVATPVSVILADSGQYGSYARYGNIGDFYSILNSIDGYFREADNIRQMVSRVVREKAADKANEESSKANEESSKANEDT